MKRFLKFLVLSVLIVSFAFGIFKLTNKYNLDVAYQNIDWSIIVKGCDDARSFDFDDEGNLYIAFNDTIRVVNSDGKDEVIIRESAFNILDIIWHDDKLFIATDNRVIEYNLKTNESVDLITNIPNLGENKDVSLLYKDNKLFVSIGSNTNAGIVEEKGKKEDVPTTTWTLTGKNFGENPTGIFSPYAVTTEPLEKVKGKEIGNASVISYGLDNKAIKLYADGIRNIKGWDIDSEGRIKGIIGGMENRGPRPIMDDKDYIYTINEESWYGWPDYSGGDPITSPRFTDGKKIEFLIQNHPDKTPEKPYYQHNDVTALNGFAIDKEGALFERDTIVFSDNKEGVLYALNDARILKPLVELGNGSYVEKIKFHNDSFFILDSSVGCLYILQSSDSGNIFNLPKIFWVFSIAFIVILFIIILFKFKSKKKVK